MRRRPSRKTVFSGRRTRYVLSVCLGLVMISSVVPAQSGTSSLRVTVPRPNGQRVAGPTSTLTTTEAGYARTLQTLDWGAFAFDPVTMEQYRAAVEAEGLMFTQITDVPVLVEAKSLDDPPAIGAKFSGSLYILHRNPAMGASASFNSLPVKSDPGELIVSHEMLRALTLLRSVSEPQPLTTIPRELLVGGGG